MIPKRKLADKRFIELKQAIAKLTKIGYTKIEIADWLGIEPSVVSRISNSNKNFMSLKLANQRLERLNLLLNNKLGKKK